MSIELDDRLVRVLSANLTGTATDAQKDELEQWLEKSELNREFYRKISDKKYFGKQIAELSGYDPQADWAMVRSKILRRVNTPSKSAGRSYKRMIRYGMAAAACMLGVVVGTLLYRQSGDVPLETTAPGTLSSESMLHAGSVKARLILPGGRIVNLEDSEGVSAEGFTNDGSTISYEGSVTASDYQLHTIEIPRGGEYALQLSDGTRIWLNADSRITYPDLFTTGERRVDLTGEAYFEVAHDSQKPFVVTSGDLTLTVLGTSFNLRAYAGEQRQATLVEGSVTIELADARVEITPGQQVRCDGKRLSVRDVQVDDYISWRGNRFVYHDAELGTVLRDLGRWYDADVVFADPMAADGIHVTVNIPKYDDIYSVIGILEDVALIKVDASEKALIVSRR